MLIYFSDLPGKHIVNERRLFEKIGSVVYELVSFSLN